MTINASKGGEIHIDGTKVWMIPFTGGSGTITLGAQITIGGVTCNVVGIYQTPTSAPSAYELSGWLKVTNASGTPGTISSGTYAGFTLTANDAAMQTDRVGDFYYDVQMVDGAGRKRTIVSGKYKYAQDITKD